MHSVHAANYTAMPIYVHALTPVVPTVDCKGGTRPALPTAGETTKYIHCHHLSTNSGNYM